MSTTIIMISGYARSGKDTLANALIEYSRTESARVSFATPLKRAVQLALKELGLGHIDAFTEDPALKALLRPLFVEVGKAARAIDKNVFVKAAWLDVNDLAHNGKELIVVPDLRYPNEIELFRKWAGDNGDTVKHVHIRREGNEAANEEEYLSVLSLPLADDRCQFEDGAVGGIAKWADKYVSDLWAKGIFKNKKLAVAYDEKAPIFISPAPGLTPEARFVRDNVPGVRIDELEERIKKLEQQVANQNLALNRVANVFDTYLSRNAYYHVLQALEGNAK